MNKPHQQRARPCCERCNSDAVCQITTRSGVQFMCPTCGEIAFGVALQQPVELFYSGVDLEAA